MDVRDVLNEELELLVADLRAKHVQLKMKASGNWLKQLETEVVQTGTRYSGRILGTHYSYYLVNGRRPGKRPPSSVIEQWIKDKGIRPKGDLNIKQLAFLIAKKIGEFGTKYYRQGGTDLISAVVTPARIERIIQRVSEAYLADTIPFIQDKIETEFASL